MLKLTSLMIFSFLILMVGVSSLSFLTDASPIVSATSGTGDADEAINKKEIATAYGDLPIFFIPNEDQLPGEVKYYSKGAGYSFYLTDDGVTYSFVRKSEDSGKAPSASAYEGYSLKLNFLGRNPNTEIVGSKELEGKVNYFIGDDPSKWKTDIPVYGGAIYKDLYHGIDLVYKGSERIIKYEYKVAPGADYKNIQMSYSGADSLKLSSSGDLLINTPWGQLKDEKPVVYQMVNGKRKSVNSAFTLTNNTVGFNLGSYDKSAPLVIDPGLSYSTYFGGGGSDQVSDIAVDAAGNAYITGVTSASGFPLQSPLDPGYNGSEDVYVTKFDPTGGALVYSTYLGGISNEQGKSIETDSSGNAYVTGFTFSTNFPKTPNMPIGGGYQDAFLTKLNPTGSALVYSRFIGGGNPASGGSNTVGNGIEVSRDGEVFISGVTNSSLFPVTANAYQTTNNKNNNILFTDDAFLMKFDESGKDILYSTYIGGDKDDASLDVAIDRNNIAYVVGYTKSDIGFPLTPGAFRISYGSIAGEGFVTLIDPKGQGDDDLVYSTYLGGDGAADEAVEAVAVDASGNAYLAGSVYYLAGFVTSPGAFQEYTGANTNYDGFVFKLNPAGTGYNDMVYSTLLSGSANDRARDIEIDESGNAYVAGFTASSNFPTTIGAFDTTYDAQEAFVTIVNSSGTGLIDSTFLGGTGIDTGLGISLDQRNNVYVTGMTDSGDFELESALDTDPNDIFVSKFITSNDPFGGPLSDLTITGISPSNANPDTSETIAVDVFVKNNGATLTIPFDVDLHDLSPPSSPPPDGQTGVDYQSVPGLLPNQETTVTFNISWPQGGYHDLYASVDTQLSVVETNETNNISGPVNIMVSKPDLVIDSLSVSTTTADINETVFVDVVIRNQGEVDATSFNVDLYDNPPSTPTAGDSGVFTEQIGGLSMGSSTTVTFQVSWGSNSSHVLIAQIDSFGVITEVSESNNLSNTANVTVMSQPDLIIESMTASDLSPDTGVPVTIDIVVKNQGSANASASSLTLYDNPAPEPPLVGQAGGQAQAVPLLVPGATATVTFKPSWPSNGSHKMYASADSAGIVSEKDETNNISGPTNISVFSTVLDTKVWDSGGPFSWEWSAGKYTTGDFNADGRTDIAVLYGYEVQREVKLWVFLGKAGSGFNAPTEWWASGPGNWDWAGSMLTAGDYDGDGDSDIGILYGYQTDRDVRLFVFPSNGINKFLSSQIWFHAGPGNWDWAGSKLVTGNFNGDTMDDIGILYGYQTERDVIFFVFPSNGFTFSSSQSWFHAGPNNWDWIGSKLTVGDYNGDGRDDVGILYGYIVQRDVRIFIFPSTGSKLAASNIWFHAGPNNWDWGASKLLSAEMTGDTSDDIVIHYGYGGGKSSIFVFPSNTVNAFTGSVVWFGPASYDWNSSVPLAGNFDGSGPDEVAIFFNNGSSWSQIYLYK